MHYWQNASSCYPLKKLISQSGTFSLFLNEGGSNGSLCKVYSLECIRTKAAAYVFVKTDRVAMLGVTFKLVIHVRLSCFLEQWKVTVFQLILLHWAIVHVKGTLSKMASILSQKWNGQPFSAKKLRILYIL